MLHLRVLGEFTVTVDGRPEPVPASRPARNVLAWLAIHPGVHARSEVAALLWPYVLDASARTSLRSALVKVTRCVGAEHVVATRDAVGLHAEGLDVDLGRFRVAAAEQRLAAAWELGRGSLLPGIDEDWVRHARASLSVEVAAVLDGLAAASDDNGDLPAAVAWMRELVARDPLSEQRVQALMLRLVRSGDRGAALTAYELLRARLAAELSAAPSPKTQLLAERIRAARDGMAVPAPVGPAPAPRLPPIVAARARLPFVGRGDERAWLAEASGRAAAEGTVVAALGGHPGVGKTALAARFAADCHADGAAVLFGRCRVDWPVAYEAIADALAQLVAVAQPDQRARWAALAGGELVRLVPALATRAPPPTGEPEGAALRTLAAVSEVLSELTAQRPALLVQDDVQWADEATLALLAGLTRAALPGPLVILLTFRRAALGEHGGLRALLHNLRRDGLLLPRTLEGLAAADAAGLVASAAGREPSPEFAGALHRHTDGNPFFMEEVLRDWEDAPLVGHDAAAIESAIGGRRLPEGVQQIIGRAIDQLGGPAKDVLLDAAILGPAFDIDVLGSMAGLEPEALLDHLELPLRIRLLEEDPDATGRLAFHHALVREVLLARSAAVRRAAVHARAARAVEALRGAAQAAEIARHYLAGPRVDAPLAVAWARRAAATALAADHFDDTARWLEAALRAHAPARALQAELLLELSVAQRGLGDREQAQASCREAMAVARVDGDDELLARAALAFAGRRIDRFGSEEREEVAALEEALAAIADGRPGLRAQLLARLALAHYMSDPARVEALAAAARRCAREAGDDDDATSAALAAEHYALWRPGHGQRRVAVVSEAIAIAERRTAPRELAELLNWRMDAHFELGDITAASEDIDRFGQLAQRLRTPELELYSRAFAGVRALLEARFDDAAADIAAVTGMAGEEPPDDLAQLLAIQHFTLADVVGRVAELVEPLAALSASYPLIPGWRLALATALVDAGDTAAAHRELETIIGADRPALQLSLVWLGTMTLAARVCRATGDAERSALVRDALAPHRDSVVFAGYAACWGPVALHLGALEAELGHRDDAARLLSAAETWALANRAPGWAAEAHFERGLAAHDAGLIAAAGAEAKRLGMARLAARVQSATGS